MVLICHVISQDHMIKGSYGFKGSSLSRWATILLNFGGHSHSGIGVIISLVCHVISQDHFIKSSSDFICVNSSWQITNLPNLVAIGIVVVEI